MDEQPALRTWQLSLTLAIFGHHLNNTLPTI
jgi:hypothetical protein